MGFAPPFVPHPGNPFGVFAASGNGDLHQCNNDINLKVKRKLKLKSFIILN